MRANIIFPLMLILVLASPSAALAQVRGGTGTGTNFRNARSSAVGQSASPRAGAFQFVSPGSEFPGGSLFGANTPAGRAILGLEFNQELRNGAGTRVAPSAGAAAPEDGPGRTQFAKLSSSLDSESESSLRRTIAPRIMREAGQGETDEQELRRKALFGICDPPNATSPDG
jgi:hypothetical protein